MLDTDSGTGSREQFARIGTIDLCYEVMGPADGMPLLLVMGLGSQMILWNDVFCGQLVERGFHVIRFDNRDCGRSTVLGDARPPTLRQLALRQQSGASYTLDDMAGDAVGLLDHLEIDRAHIVGASMGGMIAQLIAINHPGRTRSLVSIMSTTGNWRVGVPRPNVLPFLLRKPRTDRDGYAEDLITVFQTIGSKRYPEDAEELRAYAGRAFDRGFHPAGTARQMAAIQTAPDRTKRLGGLSIPSAVIHGTADPLVAPSGGRATAKAIPGARLVMLEGMGHDLPRPLWPEVVSTIAQTAGRT
jgi:pimeloyl-ACP methyl ester carboxylesterase